MEVTMPQQQERVLSHLKEIQQRDGVTAADLEELLVTSGAIATSTAAGVGITPDALEAFEKFERGEPLSQADLIRLESIVLNKGLRPAIDIQNDTYGPLPTLWQPLNDQKTALEPLIRGIGRVQMAGHPSLTYIGSAFVCGERLLMTNRHVAELFSDGIGAGAQLTFKQGITASVDLKQEVASPDSIILKVSAPALILSDVDIALLQVEELPETARPLPLAKSEPSSLDQRLVATIGYPGFNAAENLAQQIEIFRGAFDKKRLMPGRLKGVKAVQWLGHAFNALAHDCTTLGGNSGSAVLDVENANVVGVHFAGQPLVANYSVPSWLLAADSRVVDMGVVFDSA
jgi:endonuclease G, mitochondrial